MSKNVIGYNNLLVDNNKNIYTIEITSLSSGITVYFPAFITDFSDDFTSNYNPQQIYGKMDPIINYRGTTRSIKIGFDLPSEDENDSLINIKGLEIITQGLYPVYQDSGGGTATLSTPPLFRVKFANLIQNNSSGAGLLGYFNGFSFTPSIEHGFYITNIINPQNNQTGPNEIIPKLIKCSLTFNVIHEHPLGFKKTANNSISRADKNVSSYPHGFFPSANAISQNARGIEEPQLFKPTENKSIPQFSDPTLQIFTLALKTIFGTR